MTAIIVVCQDRQKQATQCVDCLSESKINQVESFEPLPLDGPECTDPLSDLIIFSQFMLDDVLVSSAKTRSTAIASKNKRRVTFDDHPTEITVPSLACQGEKQRRDLWYHPVEIVQFRTAARDACRALRTKPAGYCGECTRGLELRTSLDRQWRKHVALTCVLKAHLHCPDIDPLHLATIANQCSEASRQEAIAQAALDFCEAYAADHTIALTDIATQALYPTQNFFALKPSLRLKRSSEESCGGTTSRFSKRPRPSGTLRKEGTSYHQNTIIPSAVQ